MDKYAPMNKFQHDCWIQLYMYDLMYIDTDTMANEYHFPATYNISSTPGLFTKYCLGFS